MSVSSVLGSPPRKSREPGAESADRSATSAAPARQAAAARASPESDISDFELEFPGEGPEPPGRVRPSSAAAGSAPLQPRSPAPLPMSQLYPGEDSSFADPQHSSAVAGLVPSAPTDDVARLRGSVSSLAIALRQHELLCAHWRAEADAARAEAAASREEATAQTHRARAAEEDSAWLRAAADEFGALTHGVGPAGTGDDGLGGRPRGWASASPGLAAESNHEQESGGPLLLGRCQPQSGRADGCETGASAVLLELRGAAVEALRKDRDEAKARLWQVQGSTEAAQQASSEAVAAAQADAAACRAEVRRLNSELARSSILFGARVREAASARNEAQRKAAEAESALRAAVVGRCRTEAALVGAQRALEVSAASLAHRVALSASLSERLRLAEEAVDELHGRIAAAEAEAMRWRDATAGLEERLAALTGVASRGGWGKDGATSRMAAGPSHASPGPAAHRTAAVVENLRRSLRSAQQELSEARDDAKAFKRQAAESEATAVAAQARLDAMRAASEAPVCASSLRATIDHIRGFPVVPVAVAYENQAKQLHLERVRMEASSSQAKKRARQELDNAVRDAVVLEREVARTRRLARCSAADGPDCQVASVPRRRGHCAWSSELAAACSVRPVARAARSRQWTSQLRLLRAGEPPETTSKQRSLESAQPLAESILPSQRQAWRSPSGLSSSGTQTAGHVFAAEDVEEAVSRALHGSRRRMSVLQARLELERCEQAILAWDSDAWSEPGPAHGGSVVQGDSQLSHSGLALPGAATQPDASAPGTRARTPSGGSAVDGTSPVPLPPQAAARSDQRQSPSGSTPVPGSPSGRRRSLGYHARPPPSPAGGNAAGGRPHESARASGECAAAFEPHLGQLDWTSSLPTFGDFDSGDAASVGWAPLVRL